MKKTWVRKQPASCNLSVAQAPKDTVHSRSGRGTHTSPLPARSRKNPTGARRPRANVSSSVVNSLLRTVQELQGNCDAEREMKHDASPSGVACSDVLSPEAKCESDPSTHGALRPGLEDEAPHLPDVERRRMSGEQHLSIPTVLPIWRKSGIRSISSAITALSAVAAVGCWRAGMKKLSFALGSYSLICASSLLERVLRYVEETYIESFEACPAVITVDELAAHVSGSRRCPVNIGKLCLKRLAMGMAMRVMGWIARPSQTLGGVVITEGRYLTPCDDDRLSSVRATKMIESSYEVIVGRVHCVGDINESPVTFSPEVVSQCALKLVNLDPKDRTKESHNFAMRVNNIPMHSMIADECLKGSGKVAMIRESNGDLNKKFLEDTMGLNGDEHGPARLGRVVIALAVMSCFLILLLALRRSSFMRTLMRIRDVWHSRCH